MKHYHVTVTETVLHEVWEVAAEDQASACLLVHQGIEHGGLDIQIADGADVSYSATECTPPDAPTLRLVP